MSEASLETSVPIIPIATPTSAFLRAGASFTPSPVIAITAPDFLRTDAMRSFCSGVMRAKTEAPFLIRLTISLSGKVFNILPLITKLSELSIANFELLRKRFTFCAIALAVTS